LNSVKSGKASEKAAWQVSFSSRCAVGIFDFNDKHQWRLKAHDILRDKHDWAVLSQGDHDSLEKVSAEAAAEGERRCNPEVGKAANRGPLARKVKSDQTTPANLPTCVDRRDQELEMNEMTTAIMPPETGTNLNVWLHRSGSSLSPGRIACVFVQHCALCASHLQGDEASSAMSSAQISNCSISGAAGAGELGVGC
jgi:hypothetical protein